MAVAVVRAALEQGWQIPGDLSVVGLDDVRLAAFGNPSLTTIAQPKCEMGAVAAKMLLACMRDHERPTHRRVFETRLVIRRSTAPAKGN